MTQTMAELTDLLTGSVDKIADALRTNGLLPQTTTIQPVPAEALNVITTEKVGPFAFISPRDPHVDNRAGIFASLSALHTETDPPELRFSTGGNKYLLLSFHGLEANQSCRALVDLRINPPKSASVQLTATGNPSTMTVTNEATAGKQVTVTVPFVATSDGSASVFIVPGSDNDRFSWHSTSVRR